MFFFIDSWICNTGSLPNRINLFLKKMFCF